MIVPHKEIVELLTPKEKLNALNLAQELVQGLSGASDLIDPDRACAILAFLRSKIANWRQGPASSEQYDNGARLRILGAIEIATDRLNT